MHVPLQGTARGSERVAGTARGRKQKNEALSTIATVVTIHPVATFAVAASDVSAPMIYNTVFSRIHEAKRYRINGFGSLLSGC